MASGARDQASDDGELGERSIAPVLRSCASLAKPMSEDVCGLAAAAAAVAALIAASSEAITGLGLRQKTVAELSLRGSFGDATSTTVSSEDDRERITWRCLGRSDGWSAEMPSHGAVLVDAFGARGRCSFSFAMERDNRVSPRITSVC
jgi:hypothetical protein